MAVDDQVKVLEDEFKLIKSELRQTLVSVRDFLLDLKLPPIQEEVIPPPTQQLPVANEQESLPSMEEALPKQSQMGNDPNSNNNGSGNNSDGYGSDDQTQDLMPQMDSALEDEVIEDLGEIQDIEDEDSGMTSGDIPCDEILEEEPLQEKVPAEVVPSVVRTEEPSSMARINLLANLIRWVSTAKKEIGMEQLAAFLDVYALGGNLPAEIKGVILHLAEVATDPVPEGKTGEKNQLANEQISLCMEINSLSGQLPPEMRSGIKRLTEIIIQQTTQQNKADIWSKLLLELHGILNGNGNALHSLSSDCGNNVIENEDSGLIEGGNDPAACKDIADVSKETEEESKPEEAPPPKKVTKPAKLRLVFPTGDGGEQELDLGNLFIATDSDNQEDNGNSKISLF
jgi:hypothetical protein